MDHLRTAHTDTDDIEIGRLLRSIRELDAKIEESESRMAEWGNRITQGQNVLGQAKTAGKAHGNIEVLERLSQLQMQHHRAERALCDGLKRNRDSLVGRLRERPGYSCMTWHVQGGSGSGYAINP